MCLCSRAWCRARAAGETFVCVSARSAVGQPFVYSRRVVAINELASKCLTNYKFPSCFVCQKYSSTRKGNVTSLEASFMHRNWRKGLDFAIIQRVGRNDSKRLTGNLEKLSIFMKKSFVAPLDCMFMSERTHRYFVVKHTATTARECDKVMQICPWEHMGDWKSSRDDGKFS